MKKNFHVTPRKGLWAVVGENNSRASALFPTQGDAIDYGRRRAQQDQSELLIHRRDGRIRDRNSYGNDPFPPRG
jgi:hypothetical protein